jgi:MFS family permease
MRGPMTEPAARSEVVAAAARDAATPRPPDPRYSAYVLGVLVLVTVLNFLDRHVIAILAEDIKRDLGISDARIGFLYGTAFAIFYAVFGIPLGRLADVWVRRSLIAAGLALWSTLTALSGFARTPLQLTLARIGVGIGESSATPAAYAMLMDSFPARARATVLAVYSSGIYLGGGLGLLVGGQVVERWNRSFPDGGAPLGLAGWQAAYLAVGLPGILLAVWVRSLREPVRGAVDGIASPPEPHPFRAFARELRAVIPPFTLWQIWREGAGARGVALNLAVAGAIALGVAVLVRGLGSPEQWISLGIGVYAAVSWASALRRRDPVTAALLLRTPSLRWVALGFSLLAFTSYAFAGWTPPFFVRVHGRPTAEVGTVLGLTGMVAGMIGVALGGVLADALRQRSRTGRLVFAIGAAIAPVPVALWMLGAERYELAYAINFPLTMLAPMWIGAGASTVQELFLPRMRAIATAAYTLVLTFLGLALGPFAVGRLSDALGSLPSAMRAVLLANLAAVVFLAVALRHLERDERTLQARARAAGEPC